MNKHVVDFIICNDPLLNTKVNGVSVNVLQERDLSKNPIILKEWDRLSCTKASFLPIPIRTHEEDWTMVLNQKLPPVKNPYSYKNNEVKSWYQRLFKND